MKIASLAALLAVFFLGIFGCADPTAPAAPAEYVKVSVDGGSEHTLKVIYSMSMMGMTQVLATDAGATLTNLTDYWTVQMIDTGSGLTGQVVHTISTDEYFVCQNPVYTAIPTAGAVRYSFTGTMTHYQLVNGSLVTVASGLPLTGEYKLLD